MRWLKKWKLVVLAGAVLLLISFFAVLWLSNSMVGRYGNVVYHRVEDIPAKRVAVVLGTAKTVYGRPNRFYENRLDAVCKLYRAGKIGKILISGANPTLKYNEPASMCKDLVSRGIPVKDIYLDFAGLRTLDSMVRAHDIFGVDDFVVVSQQFHCERAIYIASRYGIKAIGFAADDVNSILATRIYVREYFARTAAVADMEILNTRPKFGGSPIHIE